MSGTGTAIRDFDVAVVGGGAVGLATALGLAKAGASVFLAGRMDSPPDDGRTAALMEPSIRFLESLGAMPGLEPQASPLASMRLIDATGALLRAPTVTFRASEIDKPWFALNIANAAIVRELTALLATNGIDSSSVFVNRVEPGDETCTLILTDGTIIRCRLVVAADGQKSRLREAAGIAARSWAYKQTALTFHVAHSRDHEDISTEIHTRHGPLTFVPFGAFRSSVVWLMPPEEAEKLRIAGIKAVVEAAQRRSSSLLGDMTPAGPLGAVPMGSLIAGTAAARRIALVGEALHAFPPIGAQGMNLGLRDAAALVKITAEALKAQRDPGGTASLATYARNRSVDVTSRTYGVDMLNRTLIADLLPLDLLRVAGLSVANAVPPLRRMMMRMGMGESPLAALRAPG